MKCDLCGHPIMPDPISGWDQGHNAWPLLEGGRCCDSCNSAVVLTRMSLLAREKARIKSGGRGNELLDATKMIVQAQEDLKKGGKPDEGSEN